MNLDTVSFTVTAPGAAATAMTVVAGDSAIVRNADRNSRVLGVAMWTKAQAVGLTQITWPSGHDLVRGFRSRNIAQQPDQKVPWGSPFRFRAQDPMTVAEIGSAVGGDVELCSILLFYEDLPGVDGHMVNMATVRRKGMTSLTVEDTVTPTAASTYSGPRALNAASGLLKADTNYAILGGTVGVVCGAITVRGVDTGNLRVSFPGLLDNNVTGTWFGTLSEANDIPMIPVINSANSAGIFIELLQDENLVAVPFSLNLVELSR